MSSVKNTEIGLGDWVLLSHKKHKEGIVLYIGDVSTAKGVQYAYGIELTDVSVGNHNGTYKGKYYFETKDKSTNRAIFVLLSDIKCKMNKSHFQNTTRLSYRKNKKLIHFDPITALNTIDIIQLLGKYWLRYICLLLPTLNKFILLRVCKTFHSFLTLEIGKEDTPEPPPFDSHIYKDFASMQLVIEDIIHHDTSTQQIQLSDSTTDIITYNDGNHKIDNDKNLKKKIYRKKKKQKSTGINFNDSFEFKQRGLSKDEEFLWNELCKTEAMVKYMDNIHHNAKTKYAYEGRMDITNKMHQTIKQLQINYKSEKCETKTDNCILWIFASPIGEERQALDLETRKLIKKADEELFYKHIIDNNLYVENVGKINLYNKRFNRRTSFELNIISYFLKFQTKLIEIYIGSDLINNNDYYYRDDNDKDDFYLILSNLFHLDMSLNDRNKISLFLSPIIGSEFNNLISLQLSACNLNDSDLHSLCLALQINKHSSLQILSLAENKEISDAYMDELFQTIANFLGNIMCLMLYDTAITDETCLTILNFYKAQFSKNEIKKDKHLREINKKYQHIDIFKKELAAIKNSGFVSETGWKHNNEDIAQFMYNIADDYGLIHKYYPETRDNNPNSAKWEKLYGEILSVHNFVISTEAIIELYERKIEINELEKEQKLLNTPFVTKRSKLRQIRLHLNAGITRTGFFTLNDIFRRGYIHKKDSEAVILIDGFVDNNLDKIQKYKEWLSDNHKNLKEFNNLAITIKEIDNEIKGINRKIAQSNNNKLLIANRTKLTKEKEKLINRRFELNDLINEAKKEPMTDPKRDPKWDKRLMSNWSNVWNKWIDLMAYKNFI